MKKTIRFLLAVVICWLFASPARGQDGRMDFEGHDAHRKAMETLRQAKIKLAKVPLDQWLRQAVAWAALEAAGESMALVTESKGLDHVAGPRGARVEPAEGGYRIDAGRRRLKAMKLAVPVRNKVRRFRCDITDLVQDGTGYVGLFLLEGGIYCLYRGAPAPAASEAGPGR